jgi:hypothetical protein
VRQVYVACLVSMSLAAATPQASAGAMPAVVATVTAETPISAGSGWLVWSVPAGAGWVLDAYHAGVVAQLPIAPRPQPFDASVGTDASGAPVVTFSRCARTPRMFRVAGGGGAGGELLEPRTGSGCRIHVFALPGGREHRLPIPTPRAASDTTPSMWRGEVAFARHAPGHADVWQVLSWSPRALGGVATLRHGRIATNCPTEPRGCAARRPLGAVEALSRDGSIVTFLWHVQGPGVLGEMNNAWELRVDDLATGSSTLAAVEASHEACTGPLPSETSEFETPEYATPEPPIAVGSTALFPELESFNCFHLFTSVLGSERAGARRPSFGRLRVPALALAVDGATVYAVVAGPTPAFLDAPECTPASPCSLETIARPKLIPAGRPPTPPFE